MIEAKNLDFLINWRILWTA